jgi:hypothetical protein
MGWWYHRVGSINGLALIESTTWSCATDRRRGKTKGLGHDDRGVSRNWARGEPAQAPNERGQSALVNTVNASSPDYKSQASNREATHSSHLPESSRSFFPARCPNGIIQSEMHNHKENFQIQSQFKGLRCFEKGLMQQKSEQVHPSFKKTHFDWCNNMVP